MNVKVITMSGPQLVQVHEFPGSEGTLAVVNKWDEGDHAYSVVAPVPGSDVWIAVGSPHEMRNRRATKSISDSLVESIDLMPDMARQYAESGKSSINPVVVALMAYLGILTPEMIEQHNQLAAKARVDFEKAREDRERQKAEAELQRLSNALAAFKRGLEIPVETFLELLAECEITLPPRTVGMLRKKVAQIGYGTAQAAPGTKIADVVWLAARKLADK